MNFTTITGDDTPLGPMLDALGTLYGPETMLRRCHEKFADDPTVIAELRYELEAQRELFEAARVRVHQLEAVRDRLARERDHQTERADTLQGRLSTALEQVRVQNLELWEAARSTCGKHTLTGDIACRRPSGHDGQHVGGFPAVTWADAREDADQPVAGPPPCREWWSGVPCQKELGHDGEHNWEGDDGKGVSWANNSEGDQPTQGCPVGRRLTAGVWSSCTLDAGHDGDHQGPVQW